MLFARAVSHLSAVHQRSDKIKVGKGTQGVKSPAQLLPGMAGVAGGEVDAAVSPHTQKLANPQTQGNPQALVKAACSRESSAEGAMGRRRIYQEHNRT